MATGFRPLSLAQLNCRSVYRSRFRFARRDDAPARNWLYVHISRRGNALETGDTVWTLDVDARLTKANFLRGALQLRGNAEVMVSPWLSAGVLHQLNVRSPVATAAHASGPSGFTVMARAVAERLLLLAEASTSAVTVRYIAPGGQ